MHFQVTARYGGRRQRYHTFVVEAADAKAAMISATEQIPPEIASEIDLVEIRVAVDPERREYLE